MPVTTARIRSMHWTDIPLVHAMESELFGIDPWSIETFWSELALVPSTRCYVVAVDSDEVIGYAGVFTSGDDADVQTVAVARRAQGRGLGRLLLHSLMRTAVDRGAKRLFLEVRSDNDAAIGLYTAEGFERTGRRADYYAPGVDAVVMRRRLASGSGSAEDPARVAGFARGSS